MNLVAASVLDRNTSYSVFILYIYPVLLEWLRLSYAQSVQFQFNNGYTCIHICSLCDFKDNREIYLLFMCSTLCRESFEHNHNSQSWDEMQVSARSGQKLGWKSHCFYILHNIVIKVLKVQAHYNVWYKFVYCVSKIHFNGLRTMFECLRWLPFHFWTNYWCFTHKTLRLPPLVHGVLYA